MKELRRRVEVFARFLKKRRDSRPGEKNVRKHLPLAFARLNDWNGNCNNKISVSLTLLPEDS